MKKLNKKGFTLIELLAVIIVLALVMVLVIPNVLNSSNSAKIKSLRLYGQRVLTKATETFEEKYLLNETITSGTYTLGAFGFNNTGNYFGCVVIPTGLSTESDNSSNIQIYLSDGQYCFTSPVGLAGLGATGEEGIATTREVCNSTAYTYCGGAASKFE